ncbi:MAG: acyl-CoA thioesterase II [Mycobacteriales bacterium]
MSIPAGAASIPLGTAVAVERQPDGSFTGWCLGGATGRIFGGQVAAQALRAAATSVAGEREAHSLHAFFLRPGNPRAPVVYRVTTIKDGRSLTTARIEASQDERTIFTALASFHVVEPSVSYQASGPAAPAPLACPVSDYVPPGTNPQARWPVEIRYPDPAATGEHAAPPAQLTWLRSRTPIDDEPSLHACALTYLSDLTLTRTAHMPLRRPGGTHLGASLDHSLWFHRPFRADEWLLFAQETTSYAGSRALSLGRLFTAEGVLVASAAQEALIRVQDRGPG